MKTDRQDIVLLSFITLIGLFIRISPALSASFPLNDGGLFYKMILDLQENHFALPIFTSYNNAQLPFAYPPLAFYLYGLISEISNIPLLKLMQFMPALISGLTIPAFFLLAREFMDEKKQLIISVFTFALIPRAFEWLIMGGGVTRSPGFLFAILAIRQYTLLTATPGIRQLLPTTLFVGLAALTHPETPIQLMIGFAVIYFWKSRTMKGLKQLVFIALGAALISAPWWLVVFKHHGLDPFFAALTSNSQDTYNLIARIFILFRFIFADEPYLTLISVLGLIGLFTMLARHKNILPIWFCLIQLIEPRGGALYMMLPLSMFVGFALGQVILPVFRSENTATGRTIPKLNPANGFITFIFLYALLSASIVSNRVVQQLTLSQPDLEALTWVKDNTMPGSRFAVITHGNPLNDATSEWFPSLTDRASVATIFGWEWVNDGGFAERITTYKDLQKCFIQDNTCIDQWAQENNLDFNYIYVRKTNETTGSNILIEKLNASGSYVILYETDLVAVLQKR